MATSVPNVHGEQTTGLEDVTRSLRKLVRSSRDVAGDAIDIAERELAMAIRISEQIRDGSISPDALKNARQNKLAANLRQDAHRVIDLVADVGTVAVTSTINFFQLLVDERRPPLAGRAAESLHSVELENKAPRRDK